MKINLLILLSFLISGSVSAQKSNNNSVERNGSKVIKDIYGRVITDENGKKQNYHELPNTLKPTNSYLLQSSLALSKTDSTGNNFTCGEEWKFSVMGTYIGMNTMYYIDLDLDGKKEIICSARVDNYPGEGYWYTLQYDSLTQQYNQTWVSDNYTTSINCLKAIDVDDDGKPEVVIGLDNGEVFVINGQTKQEINHFSITPINYYLKNIEFGDIDNDGIKEFVINDNNDLYVYSNKFILKAKFSVETDDFKIGNVDDDAQNEIILSSGKVVVVKGNYLTEKWTFYSGSTYYGKVLLSDLNKDGIEEIIYSRGTDYLDIYDAKNKVQIHEYKTDIDIAAILMHDIDNDGIEELIYGDGQWGKLYCLSTVNYNKIWSITNPNHGVTSIVVNDTDNDGKLEIVWGAGATSSGADNLYVADVNTDSLEFISKSIDGPYYAITNDDIDNDGDQEIISVSYESESGYGSGVITVFDAATKKIEWQTDGKFLNMVWTGIFDVKTADLNNDGKKEIIIVADQTYSGQIWIIDGVSKSIIRSKVYTYDIGEFKNLDISDVDNDGNPEIVLDNKQSYYIIDPSDLSIKYSESYAGGYHPSSLKVENIDNDPEKEIVICNGYISVIGSASHTQWKTSSSQFVSLELYDIDKDGKKDIVAGTDDGYIKIINGITLQETSSIKVSDNAIDGLLITNLNADSVPQFIFTSKGKLHIYISPAQHIITKAYASKIGEYNSLKVMNINGTKKIVFGTTTGIIQLTQSCYQCISFSANKHTEKISCGKTNDGTIILSPVSNPPFTFSWSNGNAGATSSNLAEGLYIVTITNKIGCKIIDSTFINKAKIVVESIATKESCTPGHDGKIALNITEGTAPYSFTWNNGTTGIGLENLSAGNYTVTISDSKNCSAENKVRIVKDSLYLNLYKKDIRCFGYNDGQITAYTYGSYPYSFSWNNGSTSDYQYYLSAGTYKVTVTDAHGCIANDSTSISSPPEILTKVTSKPDNINTPFGEGSATVNIIGGKPGYYIRWNDSFNQTSITAINLLSGLYYVQVTDNNGCYKVDSTRVEETTVGINEIQFDSKVKLYPNPSSNIVYLDVNFDEVETVNIRVYDLSGNLVYSDIMKDVKTNRHPVNLPVNAGMYNMVLSNEKFRLNRSLEIIK